MQVLHELREFDKSLENFNSVMAAYYLVVLSSPVFEYAMGAVLERDLSVVIEMDPVAVVILLFDAVDLANFLHLAPLHDYRPRAQLFCLRDRMSREHRHAGWLLFDGLDHAEPGDWVQAGRTLIQKPDLGPSHQAHAHAQFSLVAPAQGFELLLAVLELEVLEQPLFLLLSILQPHNQRKHVEDFL